MPIAYSDGPYILNETFEVSVDQLDRPESQRALAYWESKRGDGDLPRWADIDFLDLSTDMIPTMIVVDVLDDGDDYQYRFFGTGQVGFHRADLTGKRVSEIPSHGYKSAVLKQYREVYDRAAPIAYTLRALLNNVRYEAEILRLPLRVDGGGVKKIWVIETVK